MSATADFMWSHCTHDERTACLRCADNRIAALERERDTERARADGYLAERDEVLDGQQSLRERMETLERERAEMVGLLRRFLDEGDTAELDADINALLDRIDAAPPAAESNWCDEHNTYRWNCVHEAKR